MKNVGYKTDQMARYLARNRVSWQQFYESERAIIDQYGYCGAPSTTGALYESLCFAAISIRKRKSDDVGAFRCQLGLPAEILDALDSLPQ